MIVTGVDAVTALVAIANVALVAPAATVTLAGTVAAVLLLESVTASPPAGAALVSVTVPCEAVPPVTLVGFTDTAESEAGGDTVNTALRVAPPNVPLTVADVEALTGVVLTVNVAVVAPAATVTLAGTVAAAVLLLESDTTAPPLGAAALKVTVPVEEAPPTTLVGLTVTAESADAAGGVTVSVALRFTPAYAAVMVTGVELATVVVVIPKAALAAPPATVTVAGTPAALLLLDRAMTAPPDGAGPLSVTVPCDCAPPATLEGLTASDASVATPGGPGSTQRIGWSPFPALHTVIITGVDIATLLVVTVNVALLAPAGTVTLAGTDATEGLLLVSV